MNSRDSQSLGRPPDIEPDDVAFTNQIDSRHRAADARARDRHERKLKRDLLAAMRSHYAAAARAVQLEDHPLVEISRKALAVEIVFAGHYLRKLRHRHAGLQLAERIVDVFDRAGLVPSIITRRLCL